MDAVEEPLHSAPRSSMSRSVLQGPLAELNRDTLRLGRLEFFGKLGKGDDQSVISHDDTVDEYYAEDFEEPSSKSSYDDDEESIPEDEELVRALMRGYTVSGAHNPSVFSFAVPDSTLAGILDGYSDDGANIFPLFWGRPRAHYRGPIQLDQDDLQLRNAEESINGFKV
jgi:hypothetical protein